MAPRRGPTSASRPTRSTQINRDEDSPDPIALTPIPTRRRSARLPTSPTGSHASNASGRSASIPLPTSTQARDSSPGAGPGTGPGTGTGRLPTSRLRSGRRSRGYVPVRLGSQDLVVPSDEEEFEIWAEGRGESSKMAQARYEREQSRFADNNSTREGSLVAENGGKVFIPLFSPVRVRSPPLEIGTQSASAWSESSQTTATMPLSITGSMDTSLATVVVGDTGDEDPPPVEDGNTQVKVLKESLDMGGLELGSREIQLEADEECVEPPLTSRPLSMDDVYMSPRTPPPVSALRPPSTVDIPKNEEDVKGEIFSMPPGPRSSAESPRDGDIEMHDEYIEIPNVKDEQASLKPDLPPSSPARISPRLTPPLSNRTPLKQSYNSQASTAGPIFTPSANRTQPTPGTPFLESQLGPHNSYLVDEPVISPLSSRQDTAALAPIASPLAEAPPTHTPRSRTGHLDILSPGLNDRVESADILVAETMAPEALRRSTRRPMTPIASRRTPTPSPPAPAPPPASSPDALDVLDRRSPSLTPPPPTPPASPPPPPAQPLQTVPQPVDPALERFRTARSFRTRTTLQLQPYTRERALYEAALRKGGLSKHKEAIASTRHRSPAAQEDEDSYKDNDRSTGNQDDGEAIVIAPSPPPKEPSLIPLIPADFDEYFMTHGQRLDPENLTEQAHDDLQKIATARVTAEREERRKAREAKRLKAKFERLIREQERGDPDDETYRPLPPKPTQAKRPPTQAPRKSGLNVSSKPPGGRVTYTNRGRKAADPTSESEASAGVRASNASRPTPSIHQRSPSIALPPTDDGPFNYGPSPPDLGPAPRSHAISSSESDGSDDNSDSSSAPMDKRAKIARRMLPAAMLRRLEQEAMRKERDKESARRRAERKRTPSPVRPGRAVVRHGGGDGVEFADFIDMVADGRSSSHSPLMTPPRRLERDSDSDRDRPIVVDSSDSDDDSQAEEDNGGHGGGGGGGESLAQLYRGDFESLVAGKGRLPRRRVVNAMDRVRADHSHKKRNEKRHRPALGLVKQTRAPLSRGNKAMFQTHLDFEPADRTPLSKDSNRKRKYSHSTPQPRSTTVQRHRPRPAIRLDDHVIFAQDDFAFDDQANEVHDDRTPRPAKRQFGRTKSGPVLEVETLDTGIGKARSWAYLDKLSVDFGITPLPSGLYCASDSILGNGRLAELLDISRGSRDVITIPQACVAYGIELYPTFTPGALEAVVPILFDKIYEATTARVLSKEANEVDLGPVRFFSDFAVNADDAEDLLSSLQTSMVELGTKLDLLDLPTGRANRHARETMLKIRWSMVELAICLSSRSGDLASLQNGLDSVFSLLLTTGFDKAIRPLKRVLRGESDSPEITDPLLVTWIATLQFSRNLNDDTTLAGLTKVLDSHYPKDQIGPLAAERIWYLVFGLCALHQFDIHGRTSAEYTPMAHWSLVRQAIGLIKISHNEEAEEGAHLDQLQGRDRYIKIMLARCIRLSSVWQWPFDRESFSIATKDLGVIFKDRQYRNLPTESPVDFPTFITEFNMTLTAAPESKRESAFELYLRLVCVAASDLISASQSLAEAQQAERDVQRLVMTIMPVSPVKFNRILPPSARQLGQLINRYSTMVAATYFSPSLLTWLLANSKKWVTFELADFDSRQVSIRGLMYVAVACRHHGQSLHLVVNRLAEILQFLQKELDQQGKTSAPVHAPTRLEVERTMVLVVSCIRQVILHASFDPSQSEVSYPDPCLLHESWTTSVFALDLSKDLKCSTEVVATIQAFLDIRLKAMPQARLGREKESESQDEFGSLGFELDDTTLAQLGGAEVTSDPIQKQDDEFANILETVICPRIYRLLSDMLPAVTDDDTAPSADQDAFVTRLTRCFSDCAAILVIDHRRLDWSTFVGPFGKMSWSRLGDDRGRLQVGLQFMLNVAKVDPTAFSKHEEEFISLLVRSLVGSRLGNEYEFVRAVMKCDKAVEYPLLIAIEPSLYNDSVRFMENRLAILEVILANISNQLQSRMDWAVKRRPFIYRCTNLLVSSLVSNDKAIHPARVLHKEEYRAFCLQVLAAMRRILGESVVNPSVIPDIKYFL